MSAANEIFSGLSTIATVSVDGTAYVLYSDGAFMDAVTTEVWDVAEGRYADNGDGYSRWCSDTIAVGDRALFARILAEAGIDGAQCGRVGGWVDAAKLCFDDLNAFAAATATAK